MTVNLKTYESTAMQRVTALTKELVSAVAQLRLETESALALAKEPDQGLLNTVLGEDHLPYLTLIGLGAGNIVTIRDLVAKSPKDIKALPSLGKAGYQSILWFLGTRGLYLGMPL